MKRAERADALAVDVDPRGAARVQGARPIVRAGEVHRGVAAEHPRDEPLGQPLAVPHVDRLGFAQPPVAFASEHRREREALIGQGPVRSQKERPDGEQAHITLSVPARVPEGPEETWQVARSHHGSILGERVAHDDRGRLRPGGFEVAGAHERVRHGLAEPESDSGLTRAARKRLARGGIA